MANDTSLTFSLYGKDVSASKALKDVGDNANAATGHFARMRETAVGVFAGNVMENAAQSVLSFAKDSINAFSNVGSEVRLLQRYTGDSAEEMSKLRFAAEETGVSTETLAAGLGKMSKAAASTAGEKKFEAIGVSVKDMNGNFKSSSTLFDEVAEKLSTMKNGVEKTDAIMSIFGRSGMQLAPLLNQGSEGIKKFGEEAQKFGLVMNTDALNGVKENTQAHRELHAAVEGMQVQLGQYLYPVLTKVTEAFAAIVPLLGTILKPIFEAIGMVLQPVIQFITMLTSEISKFTSGIQSSSKEADFFKGLMEKFQPVISAVQSLISTLVNVFKNDLVPILRALWDFISTYLVPVFKVVLSVAIDQIVASFTFVVDVIKVVIKAFDMLFNAAKAVGGFIVDVFKDIVNILKEVVNGIISAVNVVIRAIDSIPKVHIPGTNITLGLPYIPEIPMLAEGGIVDKPTLAMIGEAGAEAVIPLSKMGGMGGGINVVVNVSGSVVQEQDLAVSVRDQIAILMRRRGLNPSILGV